MSSAERPVWLAVTEGPWGPEFVATTDPRRAVDPAPIGFVVPADDPKVFFASDSGNTDEQGE